MQADPPPGFAQCRFCLDNAPITDLLKPCHCTGTGSFVHEECLRRWQVKVCSPDDTRGLICQVCRTPYSLPPPTLGRGGREEWPTPIFEQIITSPYFERSEGGIFCGGLRQRLREYMRPGCLILRSPGAPVTPISSEHWHQGVFLIGGIWPGQGHGESDALIGVNLVGTTLADVHDLLWGLPIRTRRGGPCQQRRFLVLVAFSGMLTAELPRLVRLITLVPDPAAADSDPATDAVTSPSRSCSGALFGEPHDVLPVLRREVGIHILKAVAFQGHGVWSSTQLLSEVMRGNWGLTMATGSDLLISLSTDERATSWSQLWHTKEPLRAGERTKVCTVQ